MHLVELLAYFLSLNPSLILRISSLVRPISDSISSSRRVLAPWYHQHRLLELILLQFLLHALGQAVGVLFIAEPLLNLADLVVGAAHQRLDQQLPPRLVAVVPDRKSKRLNSSHE